MTTHQLYHLIPEPAGDWQEGDMRFQMAGAELAMPQTKRLAKGDGPT